MIAAARSRFPGYRFDSGVTLFACVVSLSLDEVGRRSFPLASCVVVPGACSRPHHLIISCGGSVPFSSSPVCRLVLPRRSLFSSGAAIVRRTAGVASHPLSILI